MSGQNDLAIDVLWGKQFPTGGGSDFLRLDANAAHAIAGAVIADGYRKPRTIATADELDALPEGTLVRAVNEHTKHFGTVFEKSGVTRPRWLALDPSDRNDGEDTIESGAVLRWYGSHSITVLWEPSGE